jgi:5-methylcytosine-specific restriction enzyme subunit McrC
MSIIQIREHQQLPHKGETLEERESFEILKNVKIDEKDEELLEKLEKRKILSINENPFTKKLILKAHSSIGIAQFTNFTVEIGPKFAEIDQIVELIEYVNDLDLEIFPESETEFQGKSDILSEIIIASFLNKVQVLFHQGMVKSYNIQKENIPALRGKLLLSQQLQNDFRGKLQFACEYDELEYNNLENQIILYCLKLCSNITRNPSHKQQINQLLQPISDLIDDKQITKDDFNKINYNQMNHHYKKIHDDCKFIIDSIKISDFFEEGSEKFTNSFFVNMDNIFEKFVFMLFDESYPNRCEQKTSSEGFRSEINKKETRDIEPDILINDDDEKLQLILDTKYKDDTISRDDRYQLSMYAAIKQKNDVYAILPETTSSKIEDWKVKNMNITIHVRYINIDEALKVINSPEIEDRSKSIRNFLEDTILFEKLSN